MLLLLALLVVQTEAAPQPDFPVPARHVIRRFELVGEDGRSIGPLTGTRTETFDALGRLHRWEERGADGTRNITWIAVFEGDTPAPAQSAYWTEGQALPYLEEVVATEDGRIYDVLYGDLGRKRRREMRVYLDDAGRELYQEYFAPRSQEKYSEETYRYDASDNLVQKTWRRLDGRRAIETRYAIEERDTAGRWTARRVVVDGEPTSFETREIVDGPGLRARPSAAAGPVEPSARILPVPFARGVVSTRTNGESSPSFTGDGRTVLFTRYGDDWTQQGLFLASFEDGAWREPEPLTRAGTAYNGALSPLGDRIVFCRRNDAQPGADVYLVERTQDGWAAPVDLTRRDGLRGSYFHLDGADVLTYHRDGDLFARTLGSRDEAALGAPVVTADGTEFSPWKSPGGGLLLFTRYVEGAPARSGVFASRREEGGWGRPLRLAVPYGWGAQVSADGEDLVYVLAGDVCSVPLALLD
ncbi:MAG: hypothetical protein AAFP86_16400, partial [Planctomycetota bacterium]